MYGAISQRLVSALVYRCMVSCSDEAARIPTRQIVGTESTNEHAEVDEPQGSQLAMAWQILVPGRVIFNIPTTCINSFPIYLCLISNVFSLVQGFINTEIASKVCTALSLWLFRYPRPLFVHYMSKATESLARQNILEPTLS